MADNTTGDAELDALIGQMERVAKLDADTTYRVMDNYLMHSDRVIANAATLKSLNTDELSLLKAVTENPT